jgi:hypothetical protein
MNTWQVINVASVNNLQTEGIHALYSYKMTQKANAVYSALKTNISQQSKSQSFANISHRPET